MDGRWKVLEKRTLQTGDRYKQVASTSLQSRFSEIDAGAQETM